MQHSHDEQNTFYFAGYDCKLDIHNCENTNSPHVTVVPAVTEDNAERGVYGQTLATLSLNVDSTNINQGEFAAVTHIDNEGLLEAIIIAGLVESTHKCTTEGHPIVRLL